MWQCLVVSVTVRGPVLFYFLFFSIVLLFSTSFKPWLQMSVLTITCPSFVQNLYHGLFIGILCVHMYLDILVNLVNISKFLLLSLCVWTEIFLRTVANYLPVTCIVLPHVLLLQKRTMFFPVTRIYLLGKTLICNSYITISNVSDNAFKVEERARRPPGPIKIGS